MEFAGLDGYMGGSLLGEVEFIISIFMYVVKIHPSAFVFTFSITRLT